MLSEVNLWVERVGMAMDVLLLLRILQLRLARRYTFIALFAVLNLFYDGIEIWLGEMSAEFARVAILSRVVYAMVFPLVTWDLFEEARPGIEKVRRLAMTRMISSLLFITLWGLLIAAFTGENEASQFMMRLAMVVWTGSVAATLAYLWVMHRGIKAGGLALPQNTKTWNLFFTVILAIEAVSCLLLLVLQTLEGEAAKVAESIGRVSDPILQIAATLATVWCLFRLRAIQTDAADAKN